MCFPYSHKAHWHIHSCLQVRWCTYQSLCAFAERLTGVPRDTMSSVQKEVHVSVRESYTRWCIYSFLWRYKATESCIQNRYEIRVASRQGPDHSFCCAVLAPERSSTSSPKAMKSKVNAKWDVKCPPVLSEYFANDGSSKGAYNEGSITCIARMSLPSPYERSKLRLARTIQHTLLWWCPQKEKVRKPWCDSCANKVQTFPFMLAYEDRNQGDCRAVVIFLIFIFLHIH